MLAFSTEEFQANYPQFSDPTDLVYTVQEGTTAFLECEVERLMNGSVSWIREKDAHILTVDREVFIPDPRISILHPAGGQLWTLTLLAVTSADEGTYQCQVSAQHKLSKRIDLVVVVPRVTIVPGEDRHVRRGSRVVIQCVVDQVIHRPHHVAWIRNLKVSSPIISKAFAVTYFLV